jgi:hypothetical protein
MAMFSIINLCSQYRKIRQKGPFSELKINNLGSITALHYCLCSLIIDCITFKSSFASTISAILKNPLNIRPQHVRLAALHEYPKQPVIVPDAYRPPQILCQ